MENLSISKLRYFRIATLQIGQFARVLEDIFAKYNNGKIAFINIDRDLADGSHVQHAGADVTQLEQICILTDQAIGIHFSDSKINDIYLRDDENYFTIEVDATDARVVQDVFSNFITDLALVEVESPSERSARLAKKIRPEDTFPGFFKRIETLEAALFDPGNKISCFLSFRFSPENEALAQKVKKFLETLDIDVTTGEAYEPRQVSEKIRSKLAENPDMIVLLVLGDGESMWTRDEIVTAQDRGASVIPIVQQGARFTPGIFGDLEWIPFEEAHIGDAFMQLSEAVRFVRRKKVEKKLSRFR